MPGASPHIAFATILLYEPLRRLPTTTAILVIAFSARESAAEGLLGRRVKGARRGSALRASLLADLPHERHGLPQHEGRDQRDQRAGDGPRHEDREAAAAQQQRAAEILLEHG